MLSNYFQLLSLPAQFDIDLAQLERAYFAAQREYHPDRFAGKPATEKQSAMQMSVMANDAYRTLKSPLLRAQYLLKQQNIHVGGERDTVKPSAALLMETLENRETLAEAKTMAEIDLLASRAEAAYQECLTELSAAFAANDFTKAAQVTLKLGYIVKLKEAVMQKQRNVSL